MLGSLLILRVSFVVYSKERFLLSTPRDVSLLYYLLNWHRCFYFYFIMAIRGVFFCILLFMRVFNDKRLLGKDASQRNGHNLPIKLSKLMTQNHHSHTTSHIIHKSWHDFPLKCSINFWYQFLAFTYSKSLYQYIKYISLIQR